METPRKLIIISTDEDPGLRIESFAVINLRGVSTNKTIKCIFNTLTIVVINRNKYDSLDLVNLHV